MYYVGMRFVSKETRRKMSIAHLGKKKKWSAIAMKHLSNDRMGNKNPAWKGDNVKYGSLHDYIKCHIPKSKFCQNCKKGKALDLANISGKYKRDLSDWEWLCRKCHMTKDGRMKNLKQYKNEK